jgi:tetratricopeptide (TPR) repeat protein
MYLSTGEISERLTDALRAIEDIAGAYYYLGRLNDALSLLQSGEQLLRVQEVQEIDRVDFLLHYADFLIDTYFLTNQNEKLMRTIVQQAHKEAIANGDEKSVATAISYTGKMLYYRNLNTGSGDYAEARNLMRQALALYEKIGDTHGIAQSLFFIGLTYERQREEEQARGCYRQALDIAREYDDKWVISEVTRHMSGLNLGKDNDTSLRYALESLRLREETGFKRALPAAHLLLGSVYMARGELDRAWEHTQLAQDLAEEMKLRSSLMSVLLIQGEIQQKQGNLDKARASFEKAATLADELGLAYGIAAAKANLEQINA